MTIGILFLAQAMNIHLSATGEFTVLPVMLFTAQGAVSVAGVGSWRWQSGCRRSTWPGCRLALLLRVDCLMTEIRAATNLTSNVIATLNVALERCA
jgi:aerobic C4-dicarboxylate transport protein